MLEEQQNSESQFEFFEIAETNEISSGERLFLEIDEKQVIVFNIEGHYFAIDDECSHDRGSLGDAAVEACHITCPRHGAKFDIKPGKALSLPAVKDIASYPIRIRDNKVEIGLRKS